MRLWLSALSLAVLTVAGSSAALTLTPLEDGRFASAVLVQCGPTPSFEPPACSNTGPSDAAVFGAPFDFEGNAMGLLGATQHSSVSSTAMAGTGSVQLGIDDPLYTGQSVSTFEMVFTLDAAALLSLRADLTYVAHPLGPLDSNDFAVAEVEFCAEECTSARLEFRDGFPDSDGASLVLERTLPAGTYSLFLTAHGGQHHAQDSFATASWAFELLVSPVPEPAALPLVAFAVLALSPAAGRSRAARAPSCSGRA